MIFLKNQKEVFERFFFPIIFSVLTFFAAVILTEVKNTDLINTMTKILAVVALGISISFGIEFLQFNDTKKRTKVRLLGLLFLSAQIAVAWFIVDIRRFSFLYANLFLLAHLFVALCIWFSSEAKALPIQARNQYFWNQNWRLFIGFQSSVLVNGVLYLGLCLAFGSMNLLFGVSVPDRTYLYLFYALATFGGTFYLGAFLLGEFKDDNESKILSTLVRYIFPILQILYFVILYVYLGKIIFTWSLPRGYIGYIVSGLIILICLSHLIIKPVQEKFNDSFLMQKIWRSSFAFLIPLLGLMLVSLYRRIDEYGFTEKRYILLILTFWMVYISFTHLKPAKSKIQTIPLSLFLVTLFTTTGPLNSYTVSIWSQNRRIQYQLLELKGELKNNELVFASVVPVNKQVRFVRSIKSYCETYGVTKLFEALGSKELPVISAIDESYCYFQKGNNEYTQKPFGRLVASTKFEVLANDNLFYSYITDEELVAMNKSDRFNFSNKDHNYDSYIQAFGFEISTFSLNSLNSKKIGSHQLQFKLSGSDQITWFPEEGSLKIIDLKPLMESLSKKPTSYVFSEHPEDSELEIQNEISKVKLRITRIEFSRESSDQALTLTTIEFVAVTNVPK